MIFIVITNTLIEWDMGECRVGYTGSIHVGDGEEKGGIWRSVGGIWGGNGESRRGYGESRREKEGK